MQNINFRKEFKLLKNKRIVSIIFIFVLFSFGYVSAVGVDKNLSNRLKGKLLLQVEDGGRIWYVNPEDLKRYEVIFANALPLFQTLSLGINNSDLERIPLPNVSTKISGIAERLSGKLLLQVEDGGRIWYVNPEDLKRYEVTWNNLMDLFRKLSLGINNSDLEKISTSSTTNVTNDTSNIQDIAPTLVILGRNPESIIQNFTYVDAGVVANSDRDGDISNEVITLNNVNTSLLGSYTVTYTVTDASGKTSTATRIVNVVGEVYDPSVCNGIWFDSSIKECVNNKIVLKNHTKKIGFLYISRNDETYNLNWRESLSPLLSKMKDTMLQLTNGKADYDFEILGSYETNQFCWNPAKLGFFQQPDDYKINLNTNEIIRSHDISPPINTPIPGSSFIYNNGTADSLYERNVMENGIPYLIRETLSTNTNCLDCSYSPMQDLTLSWQQLFPTSGYTKVQQRQLDIRCDQGIFFDNRTDSSILNNVRESASRELNFQLSDYDYIVVIFGKFGQILPNESIENKYYRCHSLRGVIGGFSDMVIGENSLLTNGLVDCRESTDDSSWHNSFYDDEGWKIMPHELLHDLGAVDIYDTAGFVEIYSERERAQSMDSRYKESIMAERKVPCEEYFDINKTSNPNYVPTCTQNKLDQVYLDKLNREKIGIE